MLKRLILIIASVISLTGCTNVDEIKVNQVEKVEYKFNESFVKLIPPKQEEDININIQVNKIFEEELKHESEVDIPNENEQYSDVVKSNIEVNIDELDVSFSNFEWFTIPDDVQVDYYSIYQYIIYGINTYYNGNVTDNFTCRLPDDIFDRTTNMIFKVNVYGNNVNLILSLDTYNDNIRVEEVNK